MLDGDRDEFRAAECTRHADGEKGSVATRAQVLTAHAAKHVTKYVAIGRPLLRRQLIALVLPDRAHRFFEPARVRLVRRRLHVGGSMSEDDRCQAAADRRFSERPRILCRDNPTALGAQRLTRRKPRLGKQRQKRRDGRRGRREWTIARLGTPRAEEPPVRLVGAKRRRGGRTPDIGFDTLPITRRKLGKIGFEVSAV
ncbi:hypothetical protein WR25_02663 [Diploscapter pachys]|uniref:Uncharacterized protein n=1 Tax=Diploscapter pachys TaxID=2018661 RepID=A0A2A2K1M7_9BILA|nr:hypothetical protein WR25_02663 [Diploscapter pachys]